MATLPLLLGASGIPELPPDVSISRFALVDEGIYRGGQPNEKGFSFLKEQGIKTIINLRSKDDEGEMVRELVCSIFTFRFVLSFPGRRSPILQSRNTLRSSITPTITRYSSIAIAAQIAPVFSPPSIELPTSGGKRKRHGRKRATLACTGGIEGRRVVSMCPGRVEKVNPCQRLRRRCCFQRDVPTGPGFFPGLCRANMPENLRGHRSLRADGSRHSVEQIPAHRGLAGKAQRAGFHNGPAAGS